MTFQWNERDRKLLSETDLHRSGHKGDDSCLLLHQSLGMTRKPQQTKRKRDESPDDASKTRQKRPKAGKSDQASLSNFVAVDSSKAWMEGLNSADEIT
jgi:hypothetical protein